MQIYRVGPGWSQVSVVFVGGEKRLYGIFIDLTKQIGGLSWSLCKME